MEILDGINTKKINYTDNNGIVIKEVYVKTIYHGNGTYTVKPKKLK